MRGTHEHSRFTVIMGGPNESGHDVGGWAVPDQRLVLFVFFVVENRLEPTAQPDFRIQTSRPMPSVLMSALPKGVEAARRRKSSGV
jgi:hypothetical protein